MSERIETWGCLTGKRPGLLSWSQYQHGTPHLLCRTASLYALDHPVTVATVKVMVRLLQKQIEQLDGENLGEEALRGVYGIVDKLLNVMGYNKMILKGL